ncbi:cytochrome b reductase 1-like protein, partial [Euroglyphus maynei]
IYKTYLCCKKIYNKIAHAFFFVISIGLVSFGFLIGFQAQSIAATPDQPVQHFYSLHSWIGLTACALFALQFLFGFITFLVLLCCDRSTAGYRARFLPTHITFGLVIFVLAIAACLAGLLQTARSRLSGPSLTEPGRSDYRDMRVEDFNIFLNAGIVINLVGACLILLAILMPYLVLNFARNRPSTFYVN